MKARPSTQARAAGEPERRPRPRRRRKKSSPEPMREALWAALADLGLTDQARRLRIGWAWREAVGAQVAARTEPHMFSRGVLTVRAQGAAWQNELTYMKRDLMAKLNAALGEGTVEEIRIIAGKVTPPARDAAPEPLPPCSPTEARQAEHWAASIDDPDLRAQFEGAAKTFYRARRA